MITTTVKFDNGGAEDSTRAALQLVKMAIMDSPSPDVRRRLEHIQTELDDVLRQIVPFDHSAG